MKTAASQFEALISELDDLTKAMPAGGDAKIAAAAGEGGDAAGEGDGAGEDDDTTAGDDAGEDMGKSFTLKLEDGQEFEAVDGAALVKSLRDRIEGNEALVLKALGGAVDLIKSLQEQVTKLSASARPRKTVLTVAEKPAGAVLAKSENDAGGMSSEEFMAKAFSLSTEGKLSGLDVATAEQFINAGQQPPIEIVRAVMGA